MKKTLGLAVITFNEAERIKQCLTSVSFASEIVVVDSESIDQTCEIAVQCGARVIRRPWPGYSAQKQFALDQLNSDWVLCLDADEYLTPDAQSEINKILENTLVEEQGFYIPRFHMFMGTVIQHGKGVDYPLRLVRKGSGHYSGRIIHEEIVVNGKVGTLQFGMIHNSNPTLLSRLKKMKRDVDAEEPYLLTRTQPVTLHSVVVIPFKHFLSYFFKHEGWKDGPKGWLLIFLTATQLAWLELRCLRIKWFGAQTRSK